MQPVDDVAFATSLQHFTERFQHAAIEYPNAHDDTRQQRLSRVELDLIRAKRQHSNRFGFAVLLLHFKSHGRFPRTAFELEPGLVADVLAQLDIDPDECRVVTGPVRAARRALSRP